LRSSCALGHRRIVTQKDNEPSRDWLFCQDPVRKRSSTGSMRSRRRAVILSQAARARGQTIQSPSKPDHRPGPWPHCNEYGVATAPPAGHAWPGQALRPQVLNKLVQALPTPQGLPIKEMRSRRDIKPGGSGAPACPCGAQAAPHGSDSLQVEARTTCSSIERDVEPIRAKNHRLRHPRQGRGRTCAQLSNVQNALRERPPHRRRVVPRGRRFRGKPALSVKITSSATTAPAC